MVGKRVQFDDETWSAVNLLRQERRRSFQQLATEAFRGLLAKYHRKVGLKEQLRASAGEEAANQNLQRRTSSSKTPRRRHASEGEGV